MLFRQIEYFQAVVEEGNFYEAGERCHVSQSAISQQIKKMEDELGVQLLDRHNRSFSLTPAGEYFYRKSLVISEDISRMIRQTKKIASKDAATLSLGYYTGYHGSGFMDAVAAFSEKYPAVKVHTVIGSHEGIFHRLQDGTIDLAFSDQRRAFSDAYYNEILAKSRVCIEIAARNPLARLEQLETEDLKNIPCILVAGQTEGAEEQKYYEDMVGLHGEYRFARSDQEAFLMVITGQGYIPVDVIGDQGSVSASVARLPLTREGEVIEKNYCAFWRKGNSGYYIEEFADMLKEQFRT